MQYIKDIINDLKKSETWKNPLTITINSVSSKDDNDEDIEMHSKVDSIDIMINDETDKVKEQLFESIKKNIKISLKNQ